VKRTRAILLLLLISVGTTGAYFFFAIAAFTVRYEAKHRLGSEQLEILRLSIHEYLAARLDERELRINGRMYDVARVSHREDSVFVSCVHDRAEERLLSFVTVLFEDDPSPVQGIPDGLLQLLTAAYLVPSQHVGLRVVASEPAPLTIYHFSIRDFKLQYDSPPPWSASKSDLSNLV